MSDSLVEDFAIHLISKKVFWSNPKIKAIEMANLQDGKERKIIVSNSDFVEANFTINLGSEILSNNLSNNLKNNLSNNLSNNLKNNLTNNTTTNPTSNLTTKNEKKFFLDLPRAIALDSINGNYIFCYWLEFF